MVMPVDDKYSTTRNEILDQLAYALGGRVAEEIVFHEPTTGASNDIEKATGLARKMITEYGMSEAIGAIKLGQSTGEVFLGRDMGHQRDYSEEVAGIVDKEVRKLIESAHDEAYAALNDNRDVLDRLVLELLERETLNQHELAEIFGSLRKRPERPTWLSSQDRQVSDRPPVLTPAELEATKQNGHGHLPPPVPADPAIEEKIDEAASVGARPHAEEHPPAQVIQVPPDQPVNPDEKH
jgi:cell division protease FtsH